MENDVWVVEKDQVMVEEEAIAFTVKFLGASVITGPETKCYKGGTEYSAPLSGSDSVSGRNVTCQTITAQADDKGKTYVIRVKATVDGNVEVRKFIILVVGPGDE